MSIAPVCGSLGNPSSLLDPRGAAVGGLEYASAADRAVDIADGRHPHDVRILGMEDDPADVEGVLQSDVLERDAAVGGLIDTIAPCGGLRPLFTGADPDDVGVGLIDFHVADGCRAVLIEDRLPRNAATDGLEHSARGRAHDDVPSCFPARRSMRFVQPGWRCRCCASACPESSDPQLRAQARRARVARAGLPAESERTASAGMRARSRRRAGPPQRHVSVECRDRHKSSSPSAAADRAS